MEDIKVFPLLPSVIVTNTGILPIQIYNNTTTNNNTDITLIPNMHVTSTQAIAPTVNLWICSREQNILLNSLLMFLDLDFIVACWKF